MWRFSLFGSSVRKRMIKSGCSPFEKGKIGASPRPASLAYHYDIKHLLQWPRKWAFWETIELSDLDAPGQVTAAIFDQGRKMRRIRLKNYFQISAFRQRDRNRSQITATIFWKAPVDQSRVRGISRTERKMTRRIRRLLFPIYKKETFLLEGVTIEIITEKSPFPLGVFQRQTRLNVASVGNETSHLKRERSFSFECRLLHLTSSSTKGICCQKRDILMLLFLLFLTLQTRLGLGSFSSNFIPFNTSRSEATRLKNERWWLPLVMIFFSSSAPSKGKEVEYQYHVPS